MSFISSSTTCTWGGITPNVPLDLEQGQSAQLPKRQRNSVCELPHDTDLVHCGRHSDVVNWRLPRSPRPTPSTFKTLAENNFPKVKKRRPALSRDDATVITSNRKIQSGLRGHLHSRGALGEELSSDRNTSGSPVIEVISQPADYQIGRGSKGSDYPPPFFNCCFHPSTRAFAPSSSASGIIPFF